MWLKLYNCFDSMTKLTLLLLNESSGICVAAASSLTRNRQVPGTDTGRSGKQSRLVAYKGY